jgi:addiction module HigA family antidote
MHTALKLSITTEGTMRQSLAPLHPGEILNEEFMQPLGITQYRLAKETDVPARRINEIVQGQRAITADTALRLAKFFGTSEMFWLNLQARYDLDVQRAKLGPRLTSVRSLAQLRRTAPPNSRAARALITSAKSGAARSGYRRKAK